MLYWYALLAFHTIDNLIFLNIREAGRQNYTRRPYFGPSPSRKKRSALFLDFFFIASMPGFSDPFYFLSLPLSVFSCPPAVPQIFLHGPKVLFGAPILSVLRLNCFDIRGYFPLVPLQLSASQNYGQHFMCVRERACLCLREMLSLTYLYVHKKRPQFFCVNFAYLIEIEQKSRS